MSGDHIRSQINVEFGPAFHQSGSCSKVKNDIRLGNQIGQRIGGKIPFMKPKAWMSPEGREILLLESSRIIRDKRVKPHHVMTEAPGGVRTGAIR